MPTLVHRFMLAGIESEVLLITNAVVHGAEPITVTSATGPVAW
ncbi:hypothetical protein [Streptomyces sp. NPDC017095]